MKPARWASFSAIVLLGIAFGAAAAPMLTLDSAQFIHSDAAEPPPDSAPWQPQSLPDNWKVSRPKVFGYAWYRLRFDLPEQPDQPYAAYIPWLRTIGAFYVNGPPGYPYKPVQSTAERLPAMPVPIAHTR